MFKKFFTKYFWRGIVSLLAVVFLMFQEEIQNKLPWGKKAAELRQEFTSKFKGKDKHDWIQNKYKINILVLKTA